MLDMQNKDALAVSGLAVIGFRDEFALMRILLIRRWRTLIIATALLYVGLLVFLLVRDAAKYVETPENLVPLMLGFLAWVPIVLGSSFLIGTPVIILRFVRIYVRHKRLRRKTGSNPSVEYAISNNGLFIKDYSGSNCFVASSEIAHIKIGKTYLVFMFRQGGLRLLPLRGFSDSDIAATKAIAQNLNTPGPVLKAKTY